MAIKMKGSALYGSPMKKYGHKSPAKMEDLSGDGKVTRKDVLIGRGVLPSPTKMKSSPMLKKDCNCWDGYKRVAGTKPCAKGSCTKA